MITINIPTARDFWKALCMFAYRRWITTAAPDKPTGIPGSRDPQHPCTAFEPRARRLGDFPCNSDGHYLCAECAHFTPEECDCQHPEETPYGFRAVSVSCPIHGDR